MQKENENTYKEQDTAQSQPELSAIWYELLGERLTLNNTPEAVGDITIPTLGTDPWSTLLQASGVEVIDLQAMHLSISDQEVERMLQVMQEQPAPDQQSSEKSPYNTQ
jgi:hypothetical protein